ncbi:high mobility group protein [Sclerotinia borealis F-4128]|uniref:High mobility group protein n=1 Tax=Sclerotinia borealis (strain F-4128) TaxID=1432307 RepID=W9CQE5_SCLBF|nr:high mobility group protein [Sclerotinia borealis F-4128]
MARPKKTEEKPKEGGDGATLQIDVASFVRTRDTFIGGLATLQEAIQSVSSAYIKHTNAVLGEHGAGYDIDTALSKLGENPLLGSLGALQRAASPVVIKAVEQAPEKKERKKRQHDPNAPKRPLTPFFLYMQTARPIIAKDLGDVPKGEVSSEGTKRWTDMALKDKALWQDAYKDNLRLYNARMHSYRRGNLTAKEMGDDAAAAYADENNIGADASADAQLVGEATAGVPAAVEEEEDAEGEPEPEVEAEAEAEVEKSPTPAPKTPKAKGRKAKGKSDVAEEIPPPSSASIVPPQKEASPARKRKRVAKKGADEPVATTEQEEATIETPKSAPKSRKKKTKTDA